MKEEEKGKEQLTHELNELRKRIAQLEEVQTEHERAKEHLWESEEKFRKMSDTANDAIIILDSDGKISYWNSEAVEIFGYTVQEAVGSELNIIIPERYREAHREGLRHFVTTGERRIIGKRLDLWAIGNGKKEFPVELSLSAVKIKGRWNALGIVRDISDRKEMEEALRRSRDELSERVLERTRELATTNERLKQEIQERIEMQERLIRSERLAVIGRIAGGISHDLRNPLSIIDNSASFLSEILESVDPRVIKQLDIIQRAIKRSNRIVTDLLDYTKARPLSLERTNINTVIEDALSNSEPPSDITIETRTDDAIPEISIDPYQIQRVFINLISNAYGAMSEGGTLTIQSLLGAVMSEEGREKKVVEVTFQDSGEGISEENLKKIFEPLFTTREKGIGLGMAIVRDIVDRHSGTINVTSEVGRGTTFIITLPVT